MSFWKKLAKIGLIAGGGIASVLTAGAASPLLAAAIAGGTGAASGALDGGWKGALLGGGLGALTGGLGAGASGAGSAVKGGLGAAVRSVLTNPALDMQMAGAGIGGKVGMGLQLASAVPGLNHSIGMPGSTGTGGSGSYDEPPTDFGSGYTPPSLSSGLGATGHAMSEPGIDQSVNVGGSADQGGILGFLAKMKKAGLDPTTLAMGGLGAAMGGGSGSAGGPGGLMHGYGGKGVTPEQAQLVNPVQSLYNVLANINSMGMGLQKSMSDGPQLRNSVVQAPGAPVSIPGLNFQIGGGLATDPALKDPSLLRLPGMANLWQNSNQPPPRTPAAPRRV